MYLIEIKGSSLIKIHLNPISMAGDGTDLSLGASSKITCCNTKSPCAPKGSRCFTLELSILLPDPPTIKNY